RLEGEVQVELSTPSFNLVGFEHQPKSEEQKSIVASAEKKLNAPAELFHFDGAKCVVEHVSVESPFGSEHKEHKE
ncbi:MAG: ZrgA family zinc uptake protein, partial [Arenicella sp.]